MKSITHKIAAISMAFIVLMTTMSFTVNMHYCGKMLVNYSINHKVSTCGMEKINVILNCEMAPLLKTSCCTNKQLIVEGQEDLKIAWDDLSLEQLVFISVFSHTYSNLFEEHITLPSLFKDYPPPFPKRDVQVLLQTFLI